MRARFFSLFLIFLVPSPAAMANHLGDFYVIPVAAHVRGSAASSWRTDLAIHNFNSTALRVEIAIAESGEGLTNNFFPVAISGSTTVTVAPNATVILSDVLNNHRGMAEVSGALLVGGNVPFALTSRTYSVDASGGTSGQTVPPTQDFLSTQFQTLFLPGLVANSRFRTNIGVMAAANPGQPLSIQVLVLGPTGNTLGFRDITVPPGAINHTQFSTATVAPFDQATATVRIVSGSGEVAAYASVVDNTTNDAMFVSGVAPREAVPSARTTGFAAFFTRSQTE